MIAYGYELNLGFVLPLDELRKVLARISDDRHQWVAAPIPYIVPANDGEPRRYVAIGYSNPDPYPNPNYLAFLFPMFTHGIAPSYAGREDNLLVCLHPNCGTSLSRGLYVEDRKIKYDMLEDWNRCWRPLKAACVRGHCDRS